MSAVALVPPLAEAAAGASPAMGLGTTVSRVRGAAEALEAVALEGVGKAALLDRVDTKFLLPVQLLPVVLARAAAEYRVLEIGGARLRAYRSRYFDSPDLACYRAHHSGRLPRYKVRVRSYLETAQHFVEVKLKTSRGRSLKSRLPLVPDGADPMSLLAARPLLGLADTLPPLALRPVLVVDYTRITLVSRLAAERVTLDFLVELSTDTRSRSCGGIAIAELKQERLAKSPFPRLLRELGQRETRVSKYCLGVASLIERAPRNRFQPLLRNIDRMIANHAQPGAC